MSAARTTNYVGTIHHIARTTTSVNGNPAFTVWINAKPGDTFGSQFRTQTDSSVGYEIENYSPRRHPGAVVLTLTPAGRIVSIRPALAHEIKQVEK